MTIDPELKKEFKKIRNRQDRQFLMITIILGLLAAFVLLSAPASAQTINMSNPGGMSERDIAVYYPNGTMQGFWNSTSVISLDANESYIFAMKPIQTNPFDDPTDWLVNGVFPTITSNAFAILLLAYIVLTRW